MRAAMLLGVWVALLATVAEAADAKKPNPVDVANTDKAKKAVDTAQAAEDKARKEWVTAAEAYSKCLKNKKQAETAKALADQNYRDVLSIAGAKTWTATAGGVLLESAGKAAAATLPAAKATGLAATNAATELKKYTTGTTSCPVLLKTKNTKKKAYDDKKAETRKKQKEYEEKRQIAPGSASSPDSGSLNKLQAEAKSARAKERIAAEKLAKALKKDATCPDEVLKLQKEAKVADDHATLIEKWNKLINDQDVSTPTKKANAAKDKAIMAPIVKRAKAAKTAADKPIADKKEECTKTADAVKTAKDEHDKAKKAANDAEKLAENPSLATTAPTTKATTAATTKAGATTTKKGDTKATTKAGASTQKGATQAGATTAKPSSSGKKDEGPDATQNVDGVPLSPDQPCCQKAAAGLCASNIFFRNQCNTECGCEKAKGTCSGQPPKKCRKDGKSGNPDTAAASAPTPKPCTDKAGGECVEWSTRTTQSPGGRTAKECSVDVGYYMQNQCTKSCNLCGNNADIDEYFCWGWAYIGECTGSAAAWMKKFCALSCANVAANGKPNASLRIRMRRLAKIARARTLRRIKAARLAAVAKVKRRRALAGRRSRAVAARRAAGRRRLSRARLAALRRRKLRLARRKAANN